MRRCHPANGRPAARHDLALWLPPSPFGMAVVAITPAGWQVWRSPIPGEEQLALHGMQQRWPAQAMSRIVTARQTMPRIFDPERWTEDSRCASYDRRDFSAGVGCAAEIPMGARRIRVRARSTSPRHHAQWGRSRQNRCRSGAVPPRARQKRRTDRLSLGHHAQAMLA